MGGENIVVAVVIIISPCYRAVGCFKMGKHSPQMKIAKHQKAKHKLKFTPNAKPAITYVSHHHLILPWVHQMKWQRTLMKNLKVDLDFVQMTFANPTVHIGNSLLECRKRLMLDAYRCELVRDS